MGIKSAGAAKTGKTEQNSTNVNIPMPDKTNLLRFIFHLFLYLMLTLTSPNALCSLFIPEETYKNRAKLIRVYFNHPLIKFYIQPGAV